MVLRRRRGSGVLACRTLFKVRPCEDAVGALLPVHDDKLQPAVFLIAHDGAAHMVLFGLAHNYADFFTALQGHINFGPGLRILMSLPHAHKCRTSAITHGGGAHREPPTLIKLGDEVQWSADGRPIQRVRCRARAFRASSPTSSTSSRTSRSSASSPATNTNTRRHLDRVTQLPDSGRKHGPAVFPHHGNQERLASQVVVVAA